MPLLRRFFLLCLPLVVFAQAPDPPLRVAIAGLVHGHVDGFFRAIKNRPEVQVVGIFDPDPALHKKYAAKYGFAEAIFFTDLAAMLDRVKPEAVASFTNTFDHPMLVEAAAPRHITVMMEKPLTIGFQHAKRIQQAAERNGIQVIVNYETTWYRSHAEMRRAL